MNTYAPELPSHACAISTSVVRAWIGRQFAAWRFRKFYEPGGQQHPRTVPFEELPAQDRIFLIWLTRGILDYLRYAGRPAILELRDCGRKLLASGVSLEAGQWHNPIAGLLLNDGTSLTIRPELAHWLAYAHHQLWLHCRERSWLLPYEELWQPKFRADSAHQPWNLSAPTKIWDGDLRFVYGLARELAKLNKAELQSLLEPSLPGVLPARPLANAVSAGDLQRWRNHYISRAETWRRERKPGTAEPAHSLTYDALDIGAKVLKGELALWVLDFLRIYGKDALLLLQQTGLQAATQRQHARIGSEFDPYRGVELRDGRHAAIERDLLQCLAGEYHAHLALVAEWTQELPFKRAHQKVPASNIKRDAERVYGIADAVAAQAPEQQAWLAEICL
ncbi:MAG TPA: hypothetical protein PLP17_10440 [Oligoflexia bacterium]|nr:hypothetical protein [Oligoflexia bacterium]